MIKMRRGYPPHFLSDGSKVDTWFLCDYQKNRKPIYRHRAYGLLFFWSFHTGYPPYKYKVF